MFITQAYNVRQTLVLMYSNSEEMHDGRRCVCVCVSVCEDDDEQLEASDTERK